MNKLKELLRKARVVKGRQLTKKELNEVMDGYLAMKALGIFDKPSWVGGRVKE